MDPNHLNRLKEEQQKAIAQTEERIKQSEKFKSDYKALQDRLRTLPHSVSHDIMVPFGKLAFMPGKIVHTNEILVLLGDNWFAERSATQAADIAGRRMKELDKNIQDLTEQLKLLKPRLGFTSDLETELQGKGEVKDIREEYDEESERLWDDQHRQNVRRYKEQQRHTAQMADTNSTSLQKPEVSDEQLWARLEELEKQEAERGEMESLSNEEEEEESKDVKNRTAKKHSEKRVSFAGDENREELEEKPSDSDDDEDGDDSEDDSYEEDEDAGDEGSDGETSRCRGQQTSRTINFSHSRELVTTMSPSGDASINSPADVYKLFKPPSILKKTEPQPDPAPPDVATSLHSHGLHDEGHMPSMDNFSGHETASSAHKAFSGQVVERSVSQEAQKPAAEAPKRVSKFRAQRGQHFASS